MCELRVFLHQADNLVPKSGTGSADPYVKVCTHIVLIGVRNTAGTGFWDTMNKLCVFGILFIFNLLGLSSRCVHFFSHISDLLPWCGTSFNQTHQYAFAAMVRFGSGNTHTLVYAEKHPQHRIVFI